MKRYLLKPLLILTMLAMLMIMAPAAVIAEDLPISSSDIKSIRLIEEGFIEIQWVNQMRYTGNDTATRYTIIDNALITSANYAVTLNGQPLELAEVYHWNHPISLTPTSFFTSIRIKNWKELLGTGKQLDYAVLNEGLYEERTQLVTVPNLTGETNRPFTYDRYNGIRKHTGLTLQIVGDLYYNNGTNTADKSIVYDVQYEPFYTQKAYVFGIPIVSSFDVDLRNHRKAQLMAEVICKKAIDVGIVDAWLKNGFKWGFPGPNENCFFLPEGRILTTPTSSISSGGGATPQIPVTYVNTGSGNNFSAGTFAHETGHTLHIMGINFLEDTSLVQELSELVIDIFDQGYYKGDGTGANTQFSTTFDYMLSSYAEIFSTATEIWFNTQTPNNNRPNGRNAMQVYHPELFNFLDKFLPQEDIPGLSIANHSTYRTPFTRKFVPNREGISVAIPNGTRNVIPEYELLNTYSFDRYFRIFNYSDANVLTYGGRTNIFGYEGDPAVAWWDWSNNSWNYNFDLMSWVVKPVAFIDGIQYYQFLHKGWDDLNISQGNSGGYQFNTTDTSGTPNGRFQFGDDGISGVFTLTDKAAGRGGLALGVFPEDNHVGGNIRAMQPNLNDDSQLWYLVRSEGKYCQIVNKASGLALSGVGGAIPGDGVPLELYEVSDKAPIGQKWRVIMLKKYASGRAYRDSLITDNYALPVTKLDVQVEKLWLDDEGYINIIWEDIVVNSIAGNAANYVVTLAGVPVLLDNELSYSKSNISRIKLAEAPSAALLAGVDAKIAFVGEMNGLRSGLHVNSARTYNFRAETTPLPAPDVMLLKATPSASVVKVPGNTNELTIVITELYSDDEIVVIKKTFTIKNNAADIYTVGDYMVYVDTKGNDQIRSIFIVE